MFNYITEAMENARAQEKNAEFTFGVHAPSLLEQVPDNQATILEPLAAETILHNLGGAVMGSVRSLNEKYGLLRQAIMYGLIWRVHPEKGIQFFVYRRTKRNNVGQLAQRLSLGVGGHVDLGDVHIYDHEKDDGSGQVIDLPQTLAENYHRERGQEVDGDDRTVAVYEAPTINGFVMDSQPVEGYVGNIHFGVLTAVKVHNTNIELKMKESHNDAEGWFTPAELVSIVDGKTKIAHDEQDVNFEPWSKLIIVKIEELVATLDVAA
jgi:predicted NUDIX family phosphoesterase